MCKAPTNLSINALSERDLRMKVTPTQSDTGANANITPHLGLLLNVRWFEAVTIGNAQTNSSLQVTAIGQFPLQTNRGIVFINMYYSPNATNTIISPTAICIQFEELVGYHQKSNIQKKTG